MKGSVVDLNDIVIFYKIKKVRTGDPAHFAEHMPNHRSAVRGLNICF